MAGTPGNTTAAIGKGFAIGSPCLSLSHTHTLPLTHIYIYMYVDTQTHNTLSHKHSSSLTLSRTHTPSHAPGDEGADEGERDERGRADREPLADRRRRVAWCNAQRLGFRGLGTRYRVRGLEF